MFTTLTLIKIHRPAHDSDFSFPKELSFPLVTSLVADLIIGIGLVLLAALMVKGMTASYALIGVGAAQISFSFYFSLVLFAHVKKASGRRPSAGSGCLPCIVE